VGLTILMDIASHPVEEVVTSHYMTFERGVAFGKLFHQFLQSCALNTNFGFGIPLYDPTIIFILCSQGPWLDLASLDLVE